MPKSKPEKLKSVNIQMTDKIESGLSKLPGGSRSANVRLVLFAILTTYRDGDTAAFDMAIDCAARSGAPARRMIRTAGGARWHKSIVWIPLRMHREIERLIDPETLLHVSDFIRGAVMGATGVDPAAGLSDDGSELWSSEVSSTS